MSETQMRKAGEKDKSKNHRLWLKDIMHNSLYI